MKDMSWNYRVVKELDGSYGICEVYYTDGKPTSWSDPVDLVGESVDEIKADIRLIRGAFDKRVLRTEKVTPEGGEEIVILVDEV
jgi:hypothetical protein